MCSIFNNLFTDIGNNDTLHSKTGLLTENFTPNYQSLFFKLV